MQVPFAFDCFGRGERLRVLIVFIVASISPLAAEICVSEFSQALSGEQCVCYRGAGDIASLVTFS